MFLYKNHKFHIEGLSFIIPDGYTLDTLDTSEEYQGAMKMISPDENVVISVMPIFCCEGSPSLEKSAEDHFKERLEGEDHSFRAITAAMKIHRKALNGYCAVYETKGNRYFPAMQYYEELYEISREPHELNFIEITVSAPTEYGVQKALERPEVVGFLKSLDE